VALVGRDACDSALGGREDNGGCEKGAARPDDDDVVAGTGCGWNAGACWCDGKLYPLSVAEMRSADVHPGLVVGRGVYE